MSILLGLSLLSICLISIPELVGASTPSNPPIHVHLTWGQDDVAHTIVISWRTKEVSTESGVLYDTVPRGGDPALYRYSKTGVHQDSVAGGTVHDVELTGLSPGTRYYFICGGGTGGYSSEKSFRTIPDNLTSFEFVMGGDSRSQPAERDKINKAMAEFDPLFVIFTGDMVNDGGVQDEWDNFFGAMEEQWVTSEGLIIPCIPARGNHEITDGEGGSSLYSEQFCLPGNERWYSLSFGENLLHVVTLDLFGWEDGRGTNPQQMEWLENDLAAHASYKWTIVAFHVPVFSSCPGHESSIPVRESYSPIFDKYGVDLVITGHAHIYERTGPINYTLSENSLQPTAENATIYFVSGGWGAPMYDVEPKWWTVNAFTRIYHFILGTVVDENLLILETKNNMGVTLDSTILMEGNFYGMDEGIVESMVGAKDSFMQKSNMQEKEIKSMELELSKLELKGDKLGSQVEELLGVKDSFQRESDMQKKEIESMKLELSELELNREKLGSQVEELSEKSRLEFILLILVAVIAFLAGWFLRSIRRHK